MAKLPQSCLSTAMVFFHKYFINVKGFKDKLDKYMTCLACIFISIKVCNQLMPLKEIISLFFKIYDKIAIDEKAIFEYSDMLCQLEFNVLNTIGFDLNIDLLPSTPTFNSQI